MNHDHNDLNLPFEPSSEVPVLDEVITCCGVVVMAAVANGTHPALLFRFVESENHNNLPPILLPLPAKGQGQDFAELIVAAVTRARDYAAGGGE